MQKTICYLLTIAIVCCASFVSADDAYTTRSGIKYSANRLMVKMQPKHEVPSNKLITNVKHLFSDIYVVYTSDLHSLEEQLNNDSSVVYTERDYHSQKQQELAMPVATERDSVSLYSSPFNDPKIGSQWTFVDADKHGISVSRTYQEKKTSPKQKIIVAVVDTGVDYDHEDLRDVMWKNPGEVPGNGIDDDNNGYIDDIYGINTLVRDSEGKATVDVKDGHSHGTHVSGSIAATQNNNTGVAGVASNVEIMAIRTVPNASDEKDVDVVEAFMYAAKNGARVINCSFGKNHNEGGMVVKEAIDHIGTEYKVLVVAAAGNSSRNIDTRPTYPASFTSENLLVVASTTSRGSMSYFSNYGKTSVDVAAPGSSIYSTVPRNRYSSMSGTSMASPNTAGVAAEVLANNPNLTPVQLKKVLMDSVTKVSAFASKIQSGGRVDLRNALEVAKTVK